MHFSKRSLDGSSGRGGEREECGLSVTGEVLMMLASDEATLHSFVQRAQKI